jgi:hypothetical protein
MTAGLKSRSQALGYALKSTNSLKIIDEEDIEASMMITIPRRRSTLGEVGFADPISP